MGYDDDPKINAVTGWVLKPANAKTPKYDPNTSQARLFSGTTLGIHCPAWGFPTGILGGAVSQSSCSSSGVRPYAL